ncbi:MAG: glycosyltransferase family 4 protein [Pseudomonadota bacterium]
MKPLRLALVRQRYTPDGGAERFMERAMQSLQAQGVSVTLITRAWRAQEGINLLRCNPFYIGSLWRDWGFARAVRRTLQKHQFDLVQSHERIPGCDIYRAGDGVHREWLKQRMRTLGIFERLRIFLSPYHHYVKAAERALFRSPRLRAVICNSHMVKSEMQRYFALPGHKLHAIYNGVDVQAFSPGLKCHRDAVRKQFSIPQEATLFLFVGSGFERKGVHRVLEAMAQLPLNAYLIVVGRDKRLKKFLQQTKALKIENRVRFVGVQSDVKPFYGAADALVLPTLYDPFPNVILEAMAAGLPVITSAQCGAAELIEHGRNGYVCDALDTPALIESMRVLMDAGIQKQVADAARSTVLPLNQEAMVEQLVQLYQGLLAG